MTANKYIVTRQATQAKIQSVLEKYGLGTASPGATVEVVTDGLFDQGQNPGPQSIRLEWFVRTEMTKTSKGGGR